MQETTIYRSDDTDFAGDTLLKIVLHNSLNVELSKAEFKIGCITKKINAPIPEVIEINLNSEETEKLKDVNTGYLAVWDMNGKKRTAQGGVVIKTKNKVV